VQRLLEKEKKNWGKVKRKRKGKNGQDEVNAVTNAVKKNVVKEIPKRGEGKRH